MDKTYNSAEKVAGDFYLRVLSYVFVVYTSMMLLFNLLRFWGFGFDTLDFGTFYQFIWNSSNGDWFDSSTKLPFSEDGSRLGFHFSVLVTIVGVVVYKIFGTPESLLALHVIAVSFACFPIFLSIRHITKDSKLACILAVIYLVNPITYFHLFFSLQDVSLAVLALSYCYYYTITGSKARFAVAALCLLLAKEHYGLVVIGFGFLWAFYNKKITFGALVALVGLVSFVIINFYIIPSFSPVGENFFLQENVYNPNYVRYQWLHKPLLEQLDIAYNLIVNQQVVYLLAWIFVPLLFFCFTKPLWLLPVLPLFAVNLLSEFPAQKTIFLYYWAEAIPAIIIATAYGFKKVSKSRKYTVAIIFVINIAATGYFIQNPIKNLSLLDNLKMDWAYDDSFVEMEKHLPQDKLIIADTGIGAHIANRRMISPLDVVAYKKADVIVYRVNPYVFTASDRNSNFTMTRYNVQRLMISKEWGITYWKFPYIIFTRGEKSGYNHKKVDKEIYTILKTY